MTEHEVETESRGIGPDLKSDLAHFEDIYKYLLRSTTQLYERKFQLGLTVFMALILLLITFMAPHAWYSYALCLVALAGLWYLFYSTDAVRVAVGEALQERRLLEQMKLKQIVLDRLSDLRISTSIQSVFVFAVVISFRPTYLWNGSSGPIICGLIIVMITASMVFFYRKITAARMYLGNIINILRKQEN